MNNEREFNVVCVRNLVMQSSGYKYTTWYLPINGRAKLTVKNISKCGIEYALFEVRFMSADGTYLYEGRLEYIDTGLRESVVVLAFRNSGNDVYELYTDTPTDGKTTPEEIRKILHEEARKHNP
jgi:hypothetical protein